MSDFIVKGPEVFVELKSAFLEVNQEVSSALTQIKELIDELKTKLDTDQIETSNELKKKSSEIAGAAQKLESSKNNQNNTNLQNSNFGSNQLANVNSSRSDEEALKQKEQGISNAKGRLEHLLVNLNRCEKQVSQQINESKKATDALSQFESIARSYLNLSAHSSGATSSRSIGSNPSHLNQKTELIGDTLHVNWDNNNSINQLDIDRVIESLSHSEHRNAQKISFTGISQLNTSILEQNGFTIQPLGNNKYSAYREF